MTDFESLYTAIRKWMSDRDIVLYELDLGLDRAGLFDGLSVTMNPNFLLEERSYYLVHALGSIVLWSQNKQGIQEVFDELRAAKETKEDQARLNRAIERYRDFETKSSELAVWLLEHLGHPQAIKSYTNFMRADLDSMTNYHRYGKAPRWAEFFACWNQQVADRERYPAPFKSRRIERFVPCKIELQEIKQQQ